MSQIDTIKIADIDSLGRTAFIACHMRYEESEKKDLLFTDPFSKLFCNNETKRLTDNVIKNLPYSQLMVLYRTRYFDDAVLNQIRSGYRQIVILGSGFDTRSIRYATVGVVFYEIDKKEVLEYKKTAFERESILPQNVVYIPGNYLKDDFISLLRENKLDFSTSTYFLWEGNSYYLNIKEVIFILSEIRDNFERFQISFDYFSDKFISKTTGYDDLVNFVNVFENMGSPFITGFENINNFTKEQNLNVIEDFSLASLHKKYRSNQPIDLNFFHYYFVCTLASY